MGIIPLEQLALITQEPRTVEKGREKGSTALQIAARLRDWKDASRMCLPALVIPHTAASFLCPVNWNTKQSGVDVRVLAAVRGSCSLSPATLNLRRSLGIDWGTSKRDRHTVTGKMNCHLAFLNLLAASNWPL